MCLSAASFGAASDSTTNPTENSPTTDMGLSVLARDSQVRAVLCFFLSLLSGQSMCAWMCVSEYSAYAVTHFVQCTNSVDIIQERKKRVTAAAAVGDARDCERAGG